jgi:hypothetical protein
VKQTANCVSASAGFRAPYYTAAFSSAFGQQKHSNARLMLSPQRLVTRSID